MPLDKVHQEIKKKATWLRGQLERYEAVLALLEGPQRHRRAFKHTAATRRRIATTQRKRFAALKKT